LLPLSVSLVEYDCAYALVFHANEHIFHLL
jgi:hypothetical protein